LVLTGGLNRPQYKTWASAQAQQQMYERICAYGCPCLHVYVHTVACICAYGCPCLHVYVHTVACICAYGCPRLRSPSASPWMMHAPQCNERYYLGTVAKSFRHTLVPHHNIQTHAHLHASRYTQAPLLLRRCLRAAHKRALWHAGMRTLAQHTAHTSSTAPAVQVPARQFPVTVHFARRTELHDYVGAAYRKVHMCACPGGLALRSCVRGRTIIFYP